MTTETTMTDLWGEPVLAAAPQPQPAKVAKPAKPRDTGNPCVALYGPGPVGATCKTCALLYYHSRSRRWYKCRLRQETHGPGSDHRVKWPACGRYQPRPDGPDGPDGEAEIPEALTARDR